MARGLRSCRRFHTCSDTMRHNDIDDTIEHGMAVRLADEDCGRLADRGLPRLIKHTLARKMDGGVRWGRSRTEESRLHRCTPSMNATQTYAPHVPNCP
jgi:hypothetical protein